jgi:hypothetical protein
MPLRGDIRLFRVGVKKLIRVRLPEKFRLFLPAYTACLHFGQQYLPTILILKEIKGT